MAINNVWKQAVYQVGSTTNPIYVNSSDSLATIQGANWIVSQVNAGLVINPGDIVEVSGNGSFQCILSGGQYYMVRKVGDLVVVPVSLAHAALASAGKVNIMQGFAGLQWQVRDIRVLYASAGLSGSSGDRLVVVTDGTTVFNNAGITAALLGTPINTVFGGSGNPVAGSVAQNTSSVAGAQIYAQYSGGTTDYSAGAVPIEVTLLRVA